MYDWPISVLHSHSSVNEAEAIDLVASARTQSNTEYIFNAHALHC